MRNLISLYTDRFRSEKRSRMHVTVLLLALAVIVAGGVFWSLHHTGMAMANETFCGMEEHVHSEADGCYESGVLVCGLPEHIHTVECLSDETADVETAEDWESTLPALTGIRSEDVVAVAESQVGYTESEQNFTLGEDGTTRNGYTRYGAWYGNAYGDWDAMFASFVLHYSGVPESDFPQSSGSYAWIAELEKMGLYADAKNYTSLPGDLVFFDTDADGRADTVAVVTAAYADELNVVQGDCGGQVAENSYQPDDGRIVGFGVLPEQDLDGSRVFTVEYTENEPEIVEIDGPETVQVDANLIFTATVDLSSGYEIAGVTVNGKELMPELISVSEDGKILTYEYKVEDVEEDMIVFLTAKQVIDGKGGVGVYEINGSDTYEGDPEYTLTVEGVPTNTKISLDSPHIMLKSASTDEEINETLAGALFYHTGIAVGDSTYVAVAYLMLDNDTDGENTYIITPYDEEGNALSGGNLVLDTSTYVRAVVSITPIQTETLCYEAVTGSGSSGNDEYSFSYQYSDRLVGAKVTGSSQSLETVGKVGDIIELTQLTDREFYYATGGMKTTTDSKGYSVSVNLTYCTEGQITGMTESDGNVSYTVVPVDENEKAVENATLYMVSDEVFSFDIITNSIVNEHTEDNGDVYLWKGDTYYVDRYHNQGGTSNGYTNATPTYNSTTGAMTNDVGVWVQLGTIRETAVNASTDPEATLKSYNSVTYSEIASSIHQNGSSTIDTTKNYGIAGPYTVKATENDPDYDTSVTQTFTRVTGHVGDEFVATEAVGTEIVYMMTHAEEWTDEEGVLQEGQYHSDWVNLGAHASDGGTRAWWYWISDYYKLNNHEDELEYMEIVRNTDGQVRLMADEMGTDGHGHEYDVWETMLFTKRNSVLKDYMLNHKSEFSGLSFNANAYLPHHVQLRMRGTVETVIDGEVYHGSLSVVTEGTDSSGNSLAPYISYKIAETGGSTVSRSGTVGMDGEQETEIFYFQDTSGSSTINYYVALDDRFDTSKVQITVRVNFIGELTGKTTGNTYTITADDPFTYELTLNEDQLREAYDTCPNSAGYDVAINLSAALQQEYATNDLTIYKIWEDGSNYYGSRDNVNSVTVTLERSKDGYEYEDVPETIVTTDTDGNTTYTEDPDKVMQFTISKPTDTTENTDTDVWSLTMTADDIALTYTDNDGTEGYYQFRIKSTSENLEYINSQTGGYTYEATYSGLTVTNTLDEDFVNLYGVKVWLDENGYPVEAKSNTPIPESVTLAVYQGDDEFVEMTSVTAEDNWEFSFTNLPKWKDKNEEFTYTIRELASDGTAVDDCGEVLLGNANYTVTITRGEENSDYDFVVTNTYTPYSMDIYKYTDNGSEAGTPLVGAEFALSQTKSDESVQYATFILSEDKSIYSFSGWTDDKADPEVTFTSGTDGCIRLEGLVSGTYVLTETKAPDGYANLGESVTFTLGADGVSLGEQNSYLVSLITSDDDAVGLKIENLPGVELPSAGGPGTWMYTLAGLLLITGAAYLLYRNNRKERGKESNQ